MHFQIQNWEQYFTKEHFFTLSNRIEILKEIKIGGREKNNCAKLQRIIMDEEGEFPLSFCFKAQHDKPHSYSTLRKKKTVSTASFAKIPLKTKIINTAVKRVTC